MREEFARVARLSAVVHGTVSYAQDDCHPALDAAEAEGATAWVFVHAAQLLDVDWQSDGALWSDDAFTVVRFPTDDVEARDRSLRVGDGQRGFFAIARYVGAGARPDAAFSCGDHTLAAGDFIIIDGERDHEPILSAREVEDVIVENRDGVVAELSQADLVFR